MHALTSYTIAANAFLGEADTEQIAYYSFVGFVGSLYLYLFPFVIICLIISIASVFIVKALWATPTGTFILAALPYLLYARWVFRGWEKAFSGQRLTRRASDCKSNKQLPNIESLERTKSRILENAKYHKNFDDCDLLQTVDEVENRKNENRLSRERSRRRNSLRPFPAGDYWKGSLSDLQANELDMDHIYVKFSDFLWAYTFIVPFSYLLWRRRTLVLKLRKFLQKMGVIKPTCDYEAIAATLLLEQTQAIHYCGRTYNHKELGNTAGFFFPDFPYVDENCEFQVAKLFAVDIDLDTKRFKKAKLGDDNLTAKETVTLLWYNTIAAQHVKLHAMANWGVNLDDSLEGVNSFLRQNSVVTTMYNFFGYSSFSGFLKTWADQGLISQGWTKGEAPWVETVNHGIKENVCQHGQIEELTKYSRFVKFVVKVRAIFFYEFNKHKHLFPGVDGEAMFVGTVLHSLDHTFMDWNLRDALYLDTTHNRFGRMAEMGQVVKVGFVSDVDGLYFHKRFKNSGHPFYESVYRKAAKIDKDLADHMDTCIIK